MSVTKSLSRIFKAWGKNTSIENFINNSWVHVSNALDGVWGSTVSETITVNHIGKVCFWKSEVFTASGTSKALEIPVQSDRPYAVTINNFTSGAISVVKFPANSNSITISITNGNEYQIISSLFTEKGV